jgi:sulfite reductase alpha subunit-like flavoprotein
MNSSLNHDEQSARDRTPDDRSLLILYATETGTAQDAADRIARECRRIYFKCRLSSMNAYPLASGPFVLKDQMEVKRIYSLTLFQKI